MSFEPELSRHLGPVQAPEQLWDRVQNPRQSPLPNAPRPWFPRIAWAAAAVAVIVGGVTWSLHHKPAGPALAPNETFALNGFAEGSKSLDLQSSEAPQIKTWIHDGAGLDVPLPTRTAAFVQVIGAKMVRKDVPTAQISYRVRDMPVTLVVSKAPEGIDPKHTITATGSGTGRAKDAKYLSWTMRGLSYTVASADARAACLLCHSGGAPVPSIAN